MLSAGATPSSMEAISVEGLGESPALKDLSAGTEAPALLRGWCVTSMGLQL